MPEIANRFDPKKNYMNLLFHHGRVLQDSEMNELMSLFWHQLSTFTGTVLKDGVCTSPPTLAQGGGWNCPDSFVVIQGRFVFVPEKYLPTGVVVGVKYRKKILTAEDERDLEDQTEGSVNEGQPGADREIIEAEWADIRRDQMEDGWSYQDVYTRNNRDRPEYCNLVELTSGMWDAVIQPQGQTGDRIYWNLKSALEEAQPGWRILVKYASPMKIKRSIHIDRSDLYIEFAPGVKMLADRDFPQIGDDSEKSIYYITGRNITFNGGIHGFPYNKTEDPNKKPRIATSTNSSTFFNNIRYTGVSKYLFFSGNIDINGQQKVEVIV